MIFQPIDNIFKYIQDKISFALNKDALFYTSNVIKAKTLIERGLDVNYTDSVGLTALHLRCNDVDIVKVLIDNNADVNKRTKSGVTPLFFCRNPKSIKMLVDNNADPNVKDMYGQVPLHFAVFHTERYNSNHTIKVLMENGADPYLRDNNNVAPIDIASDEGLRIIYDTRSLR